ncbi:MAG: hypothetical protein KA767_01545 [Saprospiraceae bacterium]|nr:hypothetical protein [Saprospiraceae bacterium]MBP7641987.1 hypothetical protein [Saprospiraceae bacterium]
MRKYLSVILLSWSFFSFGQSVFYNQSVSGKTCIHEELEDIDKMKFSRLICDTDTNLIIDASFFNLMDNAFQNHEKIIVPNEKNEIIKFLSEYLVNYKKLPKKKISFVTKDGVKFKAETGVSTTNFQLCTGHASFAERCQSFNFNQIKQLISYLQ